MNQAPPPPRGRPYWLLLILAALLLSPPAWAAGALIAGAIAATLLIGFRSRRPVELEDSGGVLLGRDPSGRQIRVTDRQLSAHGLVLGASGAGKSTTLLTVLTDHIRRGKPVVAIDMKGSPAFARELAAAAAAAGRPFRVWTLDGGDYWNPLASGNATELKDKLISTERFTEPHYQRAAERYVQTVLQVLAEARPDRPIELRDVVRMMDPMRLAGLVGELGSGRGDEIRDYLAGLTPDQVSAIRGLGTRLAIVTESHTGPYLTAGPAARGSAAADSAATDSAAGDSAATDSAGPGSPSIDLRRALAGDEVVLFSLNSSRYGKLASQIGSLVVQDLVAAAGSRLGSGVTGQATVAIDEFSALGGDHLINLLARGREAGVNVLLATQELADLDRAAPGFRDQVLGNTAVKLAHRQDGPSSAHTIAQLIGTHWVWDETRQVAGLFGRGAGRGTRRAVEQPIVHPNQIKSLQTGQLVFLAKQPRASVRLVQVRPPADGGRPIRPPADGGRPIRPPRDRAGPELG